MNVNDDGTLNVSVNRLENDNLWNAQNRHRVVIPKPGISPVSFWREFSFLVLVSIHIVSVPFQRVILKVGYTVFEKCIYFPTQVAKRI